MNAKTEMNTTTSYSSGLDTHPDPSIGPILVTGATGYVGGLLVPELLARGYRVRILVRTGDTSAEQRWPGVEIVVGEAADPEVWLRALHEVHTAYYLIHSLLIGSAESRNAAVSRCRIPVLKPQQNLCKGESHANRNIESHLHQ